MFETTLLHFVRAQHASNASVPPGFYCSHHKPTISSIVDYNNASNHWSYDHTPCHLTNFHRFGNQVVPYRVEVSERNEHLMRKSPGTRSHRGVSDFQNPWRFINIAGEWLVGDGPCHKYSGNVYFLNHSKLLNMKYVPHCPIDNWVFFGHCPFPSMDIGHGLLNKMEVWNAFYVHWLFQMIPFIYCWTVGYLKCRPPLYGFGPFFNGNHDFQPQKRCWYNVAQNFLVHLKTREIVGPKKIASCFAMSQTSRCPRAIRGFTKISSFNDRNFTPQKNACFQKSCNKNLKPKMSW